MSSGRPLLRIPSVETHHKYRQVFPLALMEDNSPQSPHVINARVIVRFLFFCFKKNYHGSLQKQSLLIRIFVLLSGKISKYPLNNISTYTVT